MPKVIPVPDELSKPFWDAVNEKRLVVQNCARATPYNTRRALPAGIAVPIPWSGRRPADEATSWLIW